MGGIKNKLSKLIYEPPFRKRRQMKSGRISIGGFDRVLKLTKYTSLACLSLAILSTIALNLISTYSSSNIESNAEPVGNVSTLANTDPAGISISISSYSSSSSTGSNDPNLSLSIPQGGGIATGRHTVTISVGSDVQEYRARFSSKTEETALVNESDSNAKIPAIDTFYVDGDGSTDDLERVLSGVSGNVWAYSYEEHGKAPAITSARVDALPPASSPVIFQYYLDAAGTSSTDINYGVKVEHPESMPAGNYIANIVYTATVEQLRQPILTSVTPNTYELGSGADSAITITGKYLSTASKAYLVHESTGEQYYCTNLQVDSTDVNGDATLTCNIPTDQTDPNIEPGTYGVYVLTNAGETAYTDAATFTYTKSSICRNNDPDSDCQVDIDDNMVPIVYEDYDGNGGGNWRIVTKEEIENNKGSWYDYGNKQWANAITLRDDYEGGCFLVTAAGAVISQDSSNCSNSSGASTRYTPLGLAKAWRDGQLSNTSANNLNLTLFNADVSDGTSATEVILGYWVYIPRYAYEIQRRDAIDRVVDPQNFDIVFQTADEKSAPAPSCNKADEIWVSQPSGNNSTNSSNAGPNSDNVISKDYRTDCWPNNRTYSPGTSSNPNSSTTWATHPAFSWGTEETGYTELNGLWVGKFEMTGTRTAPTVKPNQHANISECMGEFYAMARSIGAGTYDPTTEGGNTISGIIQNSHHLDKATSHMLKNSEWGAVTYLAHSKYGAGINTSRPYDTNVDKNGAYSDGSKDADNNGSAYGITGCGPVSAGSTSYYPYNNNVPAGTTLDADTIESPTACSTDTRYAYNGEVGVLSSTTNTIYGVYGLSGGASEYVMGNRTTSASSQTTSSATCFETPASEPYVDLYVATPNGPFGTPASWSSSTSSELYYNYDICTFETCGGTATYETITVQSVSIYNQSWGGASSHFVNSSAPWFYRGSNSANSNASPFCAGYVGNGIGPSYGSRAALLALPAGQ